MTTSLNDFLLHFRKTLWKIVDSIRREYSKDSDKDWKNTLILLGTSSLALLLALAFGRQLFHSSSAYYALLHRGEEQDIVQATAAGAAATKQEEQKSTADQDVSATGKKTKPTLVRRESTDFQVPIVGFVSVSSTWERRKQTFAMFTCSLAFVMPMTLFCWIITIYLAVVVPLQQRSTEPKTNTSIIENIPMVLSSLVWIYLVFVGALDRAQTTGGRKPWMRGSYRGLTGNFLRQWWSWACDFLPVILVKTAELPAFTTTVTNNKDGKATVQPCNYVLGYHPHGIIAVGAFCAFSTDSARVLDLSKSESTISDTQDNDHNDDTSTASFSTPDRRGFSSLFPGLDRRVVTLPQNFWTPFLREYFLSMGAVTSAKQTFRRYLQTYSKSTKDEANSDRNDGRALIVVVGGAAESLMAEQGSINLVLRNRRGFVREAIMAGAHLVPVLGFGETNLYQMFATDETSMAAKFQRFVKRTFGFAAPMFRGRSIFLKEVGVLPFRTPVVVVVGAPIAPPSRQELQDKDYCDFSPKIDRSTDEAMNKDGAILKEWHSRYVSSLQELYHQHKDAHWNMPGKSRAKSMRILR
ncbi:diacylglycerol acyltransferase [Nitzschia inconspicua]|uniref:diacylglycerol O-acyltransferase n=1 Tax=Nitzschia inconspicua TaxID=303405 RepID=A0A9K3KU31_9STRA|nr:diacylglycerol acyltransferase [Nitzschia inconspicua]